VTTALRPESARAKVLQFIARQLEAGRQAYLVYPLIEESEKSALKAATKAFEELQSGPLAGRRLALLHGKMKPDEKDEVMRAFRDGAIDVLVATTVIEVGIDVPNATVMVVEHPERFAAAWGVARRSPTASCSAMSVPRSPSACRHSSRRRTGLRLRVPTCSSAAWATSSASGRVACRCSRWPIPSAMKS
jgi:ATP-dependent helicase YprA (DUF1998 family)